MIVVAHTSCETMETFMTESQSLGSASEFAFVPIAAAAKSQLPVALRSGAMTLCALVGAHIAAALYHHFVRRDRVLMRMIAG
jgi:cytochrome b561